MYLDIGLQSAGTQSPSTSDQCTFVDQQKQKVLFLPFYLHTRTVICSYKLLFCVFVLCPPPNGGVNKKKKNKEEC